MGRGGASRAAAGAVGASGQCHSDGRQGGAGESGASNDGFRSSPVSHGQKGARSSFINTGVRVRARLSKNEWTVHF